MRARLWIDSRMANMLRLASSQSSTRVRSLSLAVALVSELSLIVTCTSIQQKVGSPLLAVSLLLMLFTAPAIAIALVASLLRGKIGRLPGAPEFLTPKANERGALALVASGIGLASALAMYVARLSGQSFWLGVIIVLLCLAVSCLSLVKGWWELLRGQRP